MVATVKLTARTPIAFQAPPARVTAREPVVARNRARPDTTKTDMDKAAHPDTAVAAEATVARAALAALATDRAAMASTLLRVG